MLGRTLNIAHRGAAGDAPENTLAAFELAVAQGAEGIELDVQLSADGVPVVIHDKWLRRTTSGKGLVSVHTAAELRGLDAGSWFNRKFPKKARREYVGLRIPTLAEAFAWVGERRCLALVELKQGLTSPPGIERAVREAIYRADVAHLTTVISFDHASLRRLRRLDAAISLGASFKRPLLAVRRAKLLGAECVAPHWPYATRGFVRRAHRAGLRVMVWTVNQPRGMQRLVERSVDGIITDHPARLAELLKTT
jgi:glycerophosphoryl diester phosphodiesterase